MALVECPECRRLVSSKAIACPHCGHPIAPRDDYSPGLSPSDLTAAVQAENRPSKEAARQEKWARKKAWSAEDRASGILAATGGIGAIVVLLLIGIVMLFGSGSSQRAPSCETDWTRCADNADLVNNYGKMIDAKVDCKIAANKLATYGTPVWGWVIFGSFYKGDDFPRTGIVRLVDDDVQFSNVFGAMQHYMVSCKYDLANHRVLDVRTGLD